jgi:hypothetical protein
MGTTSTYGGGPTRNPLHEPTRSHDTAEAATPLPGEVRGSQVVAGLAGLLTPQTLGTIFLVVGVLEELVTQARALFPDADLDSWPGRVLLGCGIALRIAARAGLRRAAALGAVGVVLLALAGGLGGCVTVHAGDPHTVAQIEATIAAREADWRRLEAAIAVPEPAKRDVAGLRALHESELSRLRALLSYEKAKLAPVAVQP